MEDKVRLLVNIYFKTYSNNTFLFQFNRIVSLNDFHKIEAFLKDCPLVKTAFLKYHPLVKTYRMRPLDTDKTFSVTCSNEDDALTILHGIEGCIKNSFLDEITRKKDSDEEFEKVYEYLNHIIDRFENLVKEICKKENNNGKLD